MKSSCLAGRSRPIVARLAVLVAVLLVSSEARAAGELVRNGLFTEGDAGQPAGWSTGAYATGPSATQFSWSADASGVGAATVESRVPNDARFVQRIPVSPSTWYRISGWIRTDGVGREQIGAYLSVMDTFFNSRDLRGTEGWQPVVLWVKTGPIDTALEVACRLGGYGALNQGAAHFTGISVEAAGAPPRGAAFVYGGAADEESRRTIPWGLAAAVLVAVGLAGLLWRYLLRPARHEPEQARTQKRARRPAK